ncbi:MAG TPA: nitrate- and nitrite sensing domain-containing protein [Anaerolineae bacterium]
MFNLGNLRIGVKLALMILGPIVVLFYFAGINLIAETTVVQEASNIQELANLSVAIGNFVHESQKERGRSAVFLASDGAIFRDELQLQRATTDVAITEMRLTIAEFDFDRFDPELQTRVEVALVELDRLEVIRTQVNQLIPTDRGVIETYTNLNGLFLDVVSFMPTLSTDGHISDLANGYAIFLRAKDKAGLERALLGQAFTLDTFEGDQYTRYNTALAERDILLEAFLTGVPNREVAIYNNTLRGAVLDEVDRLIQIAVSQADDGNFGVDAAQWFDVSTNKINLFKQIEDVQASNLISGAALLQETAQSRLILVNVLGITGIIIAVVLAVIVSRGITGQVDNITELFSQVGIGIFEARARVLSTDELGQMTANLNAMLDTVLSLVQTQEERDALQGSIRKLLEEVSDVAVGDLTVEAEVTADATGAIADSFNLMIGQLREIISNVQQTTFEVSNQAHEVRMTAEFLSEGSEVQATQIVDTSAAIDEMAVSIQQVSENAALSTSVAEQALLNARRGTKAVQDTVEGMHRIRDQVQETARRIERLGDSTKQISEIVQLIGDIADRTSILALNASIQAAMAGDAGRGFAVVAEEVEGLAERATNATRQIAGLVKTIQSETNETVMAMQESSQEVIKGSELADQAGQALSEIEGVSDQLAALIQSISQAAKQQARGSEAVAQSMGDIAQVTQQTAVSTKQAATSINQLASLADGLRGSVSTFVLPNSNGHSNGQQRDLEATQKIAAEPETES